MQARREERYCNDYWIWTITYLARTEIQDKANKKKCGSCIVLDPMFIVTSISDQEDVKEEIGLLVLVD